MSRQIAIYGRGGGGVSTVAANISAALADDGLRVVQVGCNPRHDSRGNLHTAANIPTVMDLLRKGETLRWRRLGLVRCCDTCGTQTVGAELG